MWLILQIRLSNIFVDVIITLVVVVFATVEMLTFTVAIFKKKNIYIASKSILVFIRI